MRSAPTATSCILCRAFRWAARRIRHCRKFCAERRRKSPAFFASSRMAARMGRDPKTSALNAHDQAHDVQTLFVTDGACMASSSRVNPSLTYMALTARGCDYAVSQMKEGDL